MPTRHVPRYSQLGRQVAEHEPVITQLMTMALAKPNLLSLAAGFTDNRVLPADLVSQSVRRLEEASFPPKAYLQYGMNQGRAELRRQVCEQLAGYPGEETMGLTPERVLISNGSQQSLYMSAQLFCDPGDIVLVEAPSYFVFLELLRGLGLEPRSLPADAEGRVDLDALRDQFAAWEKTGEIRRVKLLYFMGVFANPSARCWHEADKRALGEFIRELPFSLPVIEDMAYRELYFRAPWPSRSILALPEWEGLPALYAGTFTKPFATGLKVGFVASHDETWVGHLARIKGHQDFGTSNFAQAVIEDCIREGLYDAHLARIRPHFEDKMRALDEALRAEGLAELGWRWEIPVGGLLMWAVAPDGFDTSLESPFCRACLEHEVVYVPGDLCFAEREPRNGVRLSFGVLDPPSLREAARRFVAAARAVS
ncbi:MAG: PLP-dependent aminotransferase family protein [Verrucomicrobiota bacterium]